MTMTQGSAMTIAMTASPPRAGRREWIGLAVIALPGLLYAMDLTVLDLAIPALSAALRPSSAQLLWIVDIYGFLVAGLLMTMGTLGDRIGRRRMLLIGAAAFGVGSVLAAFSNSAGMLIATRALLGVAGATLAPSTLSLIRNMFLDPRQRTVAIGVWVSSYSAGSAIGPLVGGLLLARYWWGSVFLIGVPVMLLLLAVGPFLLPEFRDPDGGRADVLSTTMSLASVLSIIYGVKRLAQDGPGWAPALAIAAGLTVGAAFVRRQRTLVDPMIDVRLFRIPAFGISLAAYTFATFVAFGMFIFITQYLQLVLGLSPVRAGLTVMPFAASFIVGSNATPLLTRRFRPAFVMAGGLALATVGFGLITQVQTGSGLALLIAAFVAYALGLAPTVTLATDLIVSSAPAERAGAASALSETGSELGGALGIAIIGSLGTAVYRSELARTMTLGVPREALDAARSTLGGAVAVAAQLPPRAGADLLGAARAAFTDALHLSGAISAIVVAVTAVVVAVLLRDVSPSNAELAKRTDSRRTHS
jgi:DHA2 family multidrug resistance protein-like MFS transporter